MDYANMKVTEIAKLPGVQDLPFKARGMFAMALKAEAEGDNQTANDKLDKAVGYETEA